MESGGKLLKYLNIWIMLFWGHTLITNKCDWGNSFPKIVTWLTPTIKDKKWFILTHHLNYEQRENIPLN